MNTEALIFTERMNRRSECPICPDSPQIIRCAHLGERWVVVHYDVLPEVTPVIMVCHWDRPTIFNLNSKGKWVHNLDDHLLEVFNFSQMDLAIARFHELEETWLREEVITNG